MWKRKKKSLKKRVLRKFNFMNLGIVFFSVIVSFCTVSFCNSIQDIKSQGDSDTKIAMSALRLADSFEYYNKKRFLK